MTEQGYPRGTDIAQRAGGRRSWAVWVLAGSSLLLSIIGVFWLRLWIPGLVIGIVACIVSVTGARREGKSPVVADARVLVSALSVLVPTVIAMIALGGWMARLEAAPARQELQVELSVRADGDFTVSYNEPLAPGASKSTIAEVDATDEFMVSFTTDLNAMQFIAGIAQNNIGPQTISCVVKINDVVVLERTGDRRYVSCDADLQDLYREQIGSD